ncbi:hypothetical protein BGY98DRAFT_496605 [Russula aff. rugulosa BPL654]|nr:hypothetical protein BGY98DRAFT_496605 [Russula aff. rugulosa BPL654]
MLLSVSSMHHPPSQHRPRPSTPSSSLSAIPLHCQVEAQYSRVDTTAALTAAMGPLTQVCMRNVRSVRVDVVPRTSPTSDCPSYSLSLPPPSNPFSFRVRVCQTNPSESGPCHHDFWWRSSIACPGNREKVRPHSFIYPSGWGRMGVHCAFN